MSTREALPTQILENNRARLEPLGPEHYDGLAAVALGRDLVPFSPYSLGTEADLKGFIEQARKDRQEGSRYAFAIFDKQAGVWAGSSSYCHIFWKDDALEIGYTWFGLEHQGTGLNTAAKALMLGHAFEALSLHRVEFRIHSGNGRSRRAVEKLGAAYEGGLREHMRMPDGTRRTSVYYSILAPEWPGVKAMLMQKLK